MDLSLLRKHIKTYVKLHKSDKYQQDLAEGKERAEYYQSWTKKRILNMDESQLYEYIAKLWAMLIWGNKRYVVDKLLQNHGLSKIQKELAELVWGSSDIAKRWDHFRKNIKGIGPAMISEILCHVHPSECMLWNRKAYIGLSYLGFDKLPVHNYQLTGSKYAQLSKSVKSIAEELQKAGIDNANLLAVDYFIWDQLQVEGIPKTKKEETANEFIHDEIRDKIAEIGICLGFKTQTEVKIADGSRVDAVWESTIGNMGRIIYVFEVQTKGSIDSLIVNLLKALHNPAVQGVVAVSDVGQLEKIKKHTANVKDLGEKLKYWDYKEVLDNHEKLEAVNVSINRLGLVPEWF